MVPPTTIGAASWPIGFQRIATPQGSVPTATSAILVFVAVSITVTEFERPHATYSFLPSGVIAMFQGRLPTGIVATIALLAVSMTCTVPSPTERRRRSCQGRSDQIGEGR